jgi:sugar lactone lactonase YvrE
MSAVELFIQSQHRLGEAIIWHVASRRLCWIDLWNPALHSHDLSTGETTVRPIAVKAPIGAIAATSNPTRLALIHLDGVSLLRIADLAVEPFCNPEKGRDALIWNDAKCDRWGRLWAGTSHETETDPRGALWCIDGNGHFALGDVGFAIPNGPAVSPDGTTLYFNDSVGRTTYAYDIASDDLHPRDRRPLIRFQPEDGMPDGIITDAEGCLWIAHWGGARVSRFTPDGKLLAAWPVPAKNVTTMCFGGPGLDTLYITTARDGLSARELAEAPLSGSLFKLKPGARGLAEPLFALRAV